MQKPEIISRSLLPRDFSAFGLDDMAYVKVVAADGKPAYAIHAADGTPLMIMGGRDMAFATIRQHDMEPLSVH